MRGRLAGAVILLMLLTTSMAHSDPWDFYGGAGTSIGYAQNPRLGGSSLNSNDTVTGSLSANFGARKNWPTTLFDISYAPRATVYRKDPGLNNDTHRLRGTWTHNYSARSRLQLTEELLYTPEEVVDPNVATNTPILNSTDRGFSTFQGRFTFEKSPRTNLSVNYRYNNRTFSSDDFYDSTNNSVGFVWTRNLTQRHSVNGLYNYSIFSFKGRSVYDAATDTLNKLPGSQVQTVGAGYGFTALNGFSFGFDAGYNIIYSDDSDIEPLGSQAFSGRIGYDGPRADLNATYRRHYDNGTGSSNNTENWNTLGSARFTLTQSLSADINTNYNVNERITAAGSLTGDKLRTFNANANLTWQFAQGWNTFVGYNYYRQSESGQVNAPVGRSRRYSVGVNWSFQ